MLLGLDARKKRSLDAVVVPLEGLRVGTGDDGATGGHGWRGMDLVGGLAAGEAQGGLDPGSIDDGGVGGPHVHLPDGAALLPAREFHPIAGVPGQKERSPGGVGTLLFPLALLSIPPADRKEAARGLDGSWGRTELRTHHAAEPIEGHHIGRGLVEQG